MWWITSKRHPCKKFCAEIRNAVGLIVGQMARSWSCSRRCLGRRLDHYHYHGLCLGSYGLLYITQGKLNGHLQNYFATLGFLVMLRLATDLKSRLVTAWGNTNGKNVVFFRHPRWVSLFLNQQSVQNIVFWCLICLNARVKLNVNILGVWSKVKFRYRTRNTYYRPHIYSYISHWVVCQVLTNRYLM